MTNRNEIVNMLALAKAQRLKVSLDLDVSDPLVLKYAKAGERVNSIADASLQMRNVIEREGWGISVCMGATVRSDLTGRLVAILSYNGRAWMPTEVEFAADKRLEDVRTPILKEMLADYDAMRPSKLPAGWASIDTSTEDEQANRAFLIKQLPAQTNPVGEDTPAPASGGKITVTAEQFAAAVDREAKVRDLGHGIAFTGTPPRPGKADVDRQFEAHKRLEAAVEGFDGPMATHDGTDSPLNRAADTAAHLAADLIEANNGAAPLVSMWLLDLIHRSRELLDDINHLTAAVEEQARMDKADAS